MAPRFPAPPTGKPVLVDAARVAELQVILEGVPLPAERASLVAYARHEGAAPAQLAALERLPDRLYVSLDDAAEELAPVQPPRGRPAPHPPREESGAAPGGDDYTNARPESGAVRDADTG
jgi:Protein of unknown function (DUF2795)